MKMQKRTFKAMLISSLLCMFIYAICVFLWQPNETTNAFLLKTFISNIILGLLGSSVISGMIAVIAYLQNRNHTLQNYSSKYHELITHCSKYMEINEYNKKVEWFDNFVCYVCDLETILSDIEFIFDRKKKKLFLKNVVQFYCDFIWLTENNFRLLTENISDSVKQSICKKIDNIVIDEKIIQKGITTCTYRNNRFTANIESVNKTINDIYNNKKVEVLKFDSSLVSRNVFVILDDHIEKYVTKMIELMNESGKTEIQLEIPEEVCQKLQDVNYISSYSISNKDLKNVDCQFILAHYFDLKKNCRDN